MLRRTLTILSFLGLILSLALWIASYWHHEYRSYYTVELDYGRIMFGRWYVMIYGSARGWLCCGFTDLRTQWLPWWDFRELMGVSFCRYWAISIPLWMPTASFGGLTWYLWLPYRRRRLREQRGLCAACGYNLRGSPGPRCPECGTAFGNSESNKLWS